MEEVGDTHEVASALIQLPADVHPVEVTLGELDPLVLEFADGFHKAQTCPDVSLLVVGELRDMCNTTGMSEQPFLLLRLLRRDDLAVVQTDRLAYPLLRELGKLAIVEPLHCKAVRVLPDHAPTHAVED
ncbi:hypothetical protein [Thalassococcus sp. S3]|uniref:hypothetical protein n=1 Tax=Thalassococcus sp. S3 TaxID=2017482 RepID=UPI00102AD073|nr:hypothetical protein [Thalassococcus sp. S3]